MGLSSKHKIEPMFSMSSMTDIVFLLLIFFMLASTLVSTNAIDILLPKASGKTTNNQSVSVSIKKDLTYYIDQKRVGESVLEDRLVSLLSNETKPTIVLARSQAHKHPNPTTSERRTSSAGLFIDVYKRHCRQCLSK